MKIILSTLIFSLSFICCSPVDGSEPKPAPKPGESPILSADGQSDTYGLILSKGYNYEVPDSSKTHISNHFKHIRQVYDQGLGKHVFEFVIHIDIDDDRGIATITDRQRNEIKTDAKSPANMVASLGETHTYKWKFKLPYGFTPTSNFTHIHQLKGYGGNDVDTPIITFTARKLSNGKQELQVIYNAPAPNSGNNYLARIPLSDFIDQWVEVTEKATYSHTGQYQVTITRLNDTKQLLHYSTPKIDIWRDGSTAVRPKYGIYRSFGAGGSLKPEMRDEILRFADFSLVEE